MVGDGGMDILTLLKAKLRHEKGGFVSVLILTFIISLCLTTIISINYNIQKRVGDALEDINSGDLTAIIYDVQCPDSMLQKVRNNQYVDHIDVMKTITQSLKINGKQLNYSTFFTAYKPNERPYKIFDKNGLSFEKNPADLHSGEIYVSISFRQLYDCRVGDTAYFSTGATEKRFLIKGFFEEPYFGANAIGVKLALMNNEDFEALYSVRSHDKELKKASINGYNFINIYQKKGINLSLSEFKKSLNSDSRLINYALLSLSKAQSKSYTLSLTQIGSGILIAFLILLFIVTIIITGHSISTGIKKDYVNLGILKAVGYTKGKLRKIFVIEYVSAEIVGSLLGIAASIPAIYYLNSAFVSITGLLSSVGVSFIKCFLILAAVIFLSALFIFGKTRAVIKVSPIRAISGGNDGVYFKSRLQIPVEGKKINTKIAVRQLTSNMKQYISSTAIVAILVFFLISISVLNASMNRQTIEEKFGAIFYDIGVSYALQNGDAQKEKAMLIKMVEADINHISSISKSFQTTNKYFTVNGEEYLGKIYSNPSLIKSMLKGRVPLYDNEIIITNIVADELGVQMGDTVTVAYENRKAEYIISGIFQCVRDAGRTFSLSIDGTKKIIPDFSMNKTEYAIADSSKSGEIVKVLKQKYGSQIEVEDANVEDAFDATILTSVNLLNIVIYLVSIIFVFIVILLVCSKVFLKERTNYGIFKSLGFYSSTLRIQFALRFGIIALLGSFVGVAANILFNSPMMGFLLGNFGITSFTTKYSIFSLLAPVVVMSLCFVVFAYFVSRRIKKVDTKSLICNQ